MISQKYYSRQCVHCGKQAERTLHKSQAYYSEGIAILPSQNPTYSHHLLNQDKATYLHLCKCKRFVGKFNTYYGFNEYTIGNEVEASTYIYSDMAITSYSKGMVRVVDLQWIPPHTDFPEGFYYPRDALLIHAAKDFSEMNGEQIRNWVLRIKVMT